MRFATSLCFGVIAAAVFTGPAQPQDAGDSLRLYAVHITRTPKESWTGNGVYLGRGIVITAAHVAGLGFWRRPRVEIAGSTLPTKVLKDGHFHNVDITLLSVDEAAVPVRLGLRRMPLCRNPLWSNEPVIVATPEGVGRAHVMAPSLLPPSIPAEYRSVISYVAETGDSGSGIFDANKKCLLGIISGKISQHPIRTGSGLAFKPSRDIAKYFVPASTIADFIPPDVRF